MARSQVFPVRFPSAQLDQLKALADRQGVPAAVVVRDLVAQGLARKGAAAAHGPLVEALHAVLPVYLNPLVEQLVAARFDAVVARELAQGAAFAALLAQPGMTPDRARELVTNTLGQAVKVAKRRVRETPDLTINAKDGQE